MKYTLLCNYVTTGLAEIELPDNLDWNSIADWCVKRNTFYYLLVDATEWAEAKFELDSPDTDLKHPDSVEVYAVKENGMTDWKTQVDAYYE